MSPATALRLARPSSRADRGRFLLIAVATSLAGGLLIAIAHIVRIPVGNGSEAGQHGLANYVTESGLRPGVVIAALLLAVPVLALAVQALRVGSVARDRRMAALRLAGATPRDVRAIAAAEAAGAAIAGALLAAPAYLLLWLVVGALPPSGARMLDAPDALDLAAWALLAPVAAVAGAIAGAAIHGRAVVEPLGVRRRARAPRPGRVNLAVLLGGLALVIGALVAVPRFSRVGGGEGVLIVASLTGVLLVAFAAGTRLVLRSAQLLARRRGAEALLASRRLRADPRSAGRVAGVLLVCGVALGFESVLLSAQLFPSAGLDRQIDSFYLTGYAAAGLVVLAGAGVAVLTMLVGAADALLDARRPLATLGALGVDEGLLLRVLARQLSATAVPAIVVGVLVGGPVITLLGAVGLAGDAGALGLLARLLGPGLLMALVAGLALFAVARVAARLLRPMIRAAIDPENLRVA
jgi:hypothetical protein